MSNSDYKISKMGNGTLGLTHKWHVPTKYDVADFCIHLDCRHYITPMHTWARVTFDSNIDRDTGFVSMLLAIHENETH